MIQKRNSESIKIQDSLNYIISATSCCMNFCMLLDIHRSNKFTQSFQEGVVRHDWVCPKLGQKVSQFHLKNDVICKVVLWHVVRDPKL